MSDINLGSGLFWLVIAFLIGYLVVVIGDVVAIIFYLKNNNPNLMFAIIPLSVIAVLGLKDFFTIIGKMFF